MTNKWSVALVEKTISSLRNIDSFNPLDGCLHLKCVDGRYGMITVANLMNNNLEIQVKTSNQKIHYCSSEELTEDGWVID